MSQQLAGGVATIEQQFVRTSRPLYGHLVSLLEGAISRGEIPSGARVPPERELAQRLRISRTTVVAAYRELESRGLLRGYAGCGAADEDDGAPDQTSGERACPHHRFVATCCLAYRRRSNRACHPCCPG